MKLSTKITIGLFACLFAVFLSIYYFDSIQSHFFFASFVSVGAYAILWISIILRPNEAQIQEDKLRAKRQFKYCYSKINQILNSMEGGISVQWQEGEGTSASSKEFADFSGKRKLYYAFRGSLASKGMDVLVYYDVDDENICGYRPFPAGYAIIDPFETWKPYDNSNAQFQTNRFYKNQNGSPSLRLSLDNMNNRAQPMPNFTPSDDAVEESYRRMNQN